MARFVLEALHASFCGLYNLIDAGKILAGNYSFDTDGLNLLWRSNIGVADESWYLWNVRNGITNDGADQMINKGFRYYSVRIAAGLEVDVYILHMDAETTEKDNAARESQMTQLVDMILASNNKRPIIIMGDTNCRYTRDNMKGLMFDRINADPRFEMHDPWIDFPRKGVMPNVGEPSIMVPKKYDKTNWDAYQTGEVVDKVFYINNKDAHGVTLTATKYTHDLDFTWPDGSEISDHYPIVIEFEIENAGEVLTGGEYYLRNVKTGKFLAAGDDWGTRGMIGRTGNRLTLNSAGAEGEFYIATTGGYLGDNLYLDNQNKCIYNFTRIEGTPYYNVTLNGNALTVDAGNLLQTGAVDTSDLAQQWEVISPQQLVDEISKNASEDNPLDATFFIKGANFARNDGDNSAWKVTKKDGGLEKMGAENTGKNDGISIYTIGGRKTGNTEGRAEQKITGLPVGKYEIEFDFASSTPNGHVIINTEGFSQNVAGSGGVGTSFDLYAADAYFKSGNGHYKYTFNVTSRELTIQLYKEHNGSKQYAYFDNFVLTYLGPTAEDLAALDRVKKAIDDAQSKAVAAGLANYNNRSVVDAYENRLIVGDGTKEVHNTYLALANAAAKQSAIPADMRYAVLNNSFEMGDLTEWDASGAQNARVEAADEAGTDGSYIFLADGGELKQNIEVTLPGGIYEVKAMLSKGAVLFVGGKTAAAATADGLQEVSLKFILTNGSVSLGVRGDAAFRADNFTLTRLGDQMTASAYEMLEIAMADVTERANKMGEEYAKKLDLTKYREMIDNLAVEGDGTKEFQEIYGKLREIVYSQPAPTPEKPAAVDYTNAIINPSFEFGTTLGWNATFVGDTGVKENANDTYKMSSADGKYVFNTWSDAAGTQLSQTITGLPSGHYRLVVTLAADKDSYVCIRANDKVESRQMLSDKGVGQDYMLEFDVASNTTEVTIAVQGGNADGTCPAVGGAWYKADNFRLYRHGDGEKKVCDFYDRLQKAIRRLEVLANELPEKYSSQWDAHDYQDLIDEHVNSDHTADPMGSNGNPEIEELYARFRALVFSQTETGADMSGAITNQSFELGDMTGWNITIAPTADLKVVEPGEPGSTYYASPVDGKYLFNSWLGNKSTPLTAQIKGVPAGTYRLSAMVASDGGNRFYLAVNGKPGEMLTTANKTQFEEISVEFTIEGEGEDVTIGLYPSVDGSFDADTDPLNPGPWFKADDFRLTLIGRNINVEWQPEYPEAGYGTLILPFDAEVPAGMQVNLLTGAKPSDVNNENSLRQIATLEPQERIAANTPYVVVIDNKANANGTGSYTFSGMTTHTQDKYEHGLLTGSLVESAPSLGELHLQCSGAHTLFSYHDADTEHEPIAANHAYIASGVKFNDAQGNELPFISGLYFSEPATTIEWSMDITACGTIVLPFDAEVPEGIDLFALTEMTTMRTFEPAAGGESMNYQLLVLEQVSAIEANVPYIVMPSADVPEAVANGLEDGTKYTFSGIPANEGETVEGAVLTGTFVNKELSEGGDCVLADDGSEGRFVKLAPGEVSMVPAHHAYIANTLPGVTANWLLFKDPENGTITGIDSILLDENARVDVYTVAGVAVRTNVAPAEALNSLAPGVYVLRIGGNSLKVLKR